MMINQKLNTNKLFEKVLRTAPEPYEYFSENQVHGLLTDRPLEYYRFVKDELTGIAEGRSELELPAKQVFSDPKADSDFRVMPCVIRTADKTTKTIKIVGTNTLQNIIPDQITVGKAFAVHPTENFVSHIFEACLLSSARTGICAAIAIELLATTRNKVTVYGAGRVGYYAAFYAAALGNVDEVTIVDIDHARAVQSAALLNAQVPSTRFLAATKEETIDTDVLILATTSTTPICSPPGLGANLIVSLGADTDYQTELSSQWASLADIFVDTEDCLRFGDIQAWKKKGLIPTDKKILGLLDLLGGGDILPDPDKKQRVFVSTGSALFDNLTIGYLLDRTQTDNAQKIKT